MKANFDLVKTLMLIGKDEDLAQVFKANVSDEFSEVLSAAKAGLISDNAKEHVQGIFENIVVKRQSLMNAYNAIDLPKEKPVASEKKPATASKPKKKTTTPELPKHGEKLDKKELPKEYNKIRIEADIKANGGTPTEFHKAMLSLNDMKNIYYRLNAKGKRQRYTDEMNFTDEDCRAIVAAVRLLKNKTEKLLK